LNNALSWLAEQISTITKDDPGTIIVKVTAALLVAGLVYLVFGQTTQSPVVLSPEQVATNLEPIGSVSVAAPPAAEPAAKPAAPAAAPAPAAEAKPAPAKPAQTESAQTESAPAEAAPPAASEPAASEPAAAAEPGAADAPAAESAPAESAPAEAGAAAPAAAEPQSAQAPAVPAQPATTAPYGGPGNTYTVPVAPRHLAPSHGAPRWAPQFSPMPPLPERR